MTDLSEHYHDGGQWKGRTNHQCNHCPYASIDEAKTRSHVVDRHLSPTAAQPVQRVSPLVGPKGEPIVVDVDPAATPFGSLTDLDKVTRLQLDKAAADLGLDTSGLRSKADVLAAIVDATPTTPIDSAGDGAHQEDPDQ